MTTAVLQINHPTLHIRELPSTAPGQPLVLLHGWGVSSVVFNEFAELLLPDRDIILVDLPGFGGSEIWPHLDLDTLLDTLSNQLPEHFSLLGWSLGGMVATAFCQRYPERVSHLITLASNACFVASSEWPAAMPEKTFRQFCDFFNTQPDACIKQFIGLQTQGDRQQRQLVKKLRCLNNQQTNVNWHRLLALLGEIDNREALSNLTLPGLHFFGDNDALVPAVAAAEISALNAGQKTELLKESCHALHLSVTDKIAQKINQFLLRSVRHTEQLNKQLVAASFSRAATSYDRAATFQRKIADQVLSKIPQKTCVGHVLDVGCGTGYLSAGIRDQFPNSHITALDLAPGMLAYAQAARPVANRWLCGDAESLPLPEASFDLVVSSLTYQWCEHPELWGAELRRVIKNGGTAVFSTFGHNTLTELRSAWQAVDDFVHVNRFIDVKTLGKLLSATGLHCELVVEKYQSHYKNLNDLMRELKAIGAHNINSGRNARMTGRERLHKLTEAYEKFRNSDGLLPASYQVVYGIVTNNL